MCTTAGTVLLVTVTLRRKVEKEDHAKSLRNKEQNEAEHGKSAINGMHILVIPLASVDSMLYPVFAPDCKQRMGFFALPLRSSHSTHVTCN